MTTTFNHLDTDSVRQAALTSVNNAMKEKDLPPAYVIGFKGSYAMGLQTSDSDLDIIAYVQPNVEQELLFGHRPLSKEFKIEQTDDHPAIEVNVQSITHLTRSLHKIPFNTVEVFAGAMEPEYTNSEGEMITEHMRSVLSSTEAVREFQKTLFFMGYNTFAKFLKLDQQWQESSDPTRNNIKDARNKAFAKAALFYSILSNDYDTSIFNTMHSTNQRVNIYHAHKNGAINNQLIGLVQTFYHTDYIKQHFIDQSLPISTTHEYKKAIQYMLSII